MHKCSFFVARHLNIFRRLSFSLRETFESKHIFCCDHEAVSLAQATLQRFGHSSKPRQPGTVDKSKESLVFSNYCTFSWFIDCFPAVRIEFRSWIRQLLLRDYHGSDLSYHFAVEYFQNSQHFRSDTHTWNYHWRK